ncbi:hypothetical protein [Nocardia cyriacigeorgica]|uniref:hypothetical protein n=1 Tax=Nocardia cyriacigeorgica TaxID=135487 RepID=UPI002457B363|nr:hypothetical protein [Nocardia cyriacigeorgica]
MNSRAHAFTYRTRHAEVPTRRVTVYFDGPTPDDALVLEYAATNTEAWEFTSAAVHAGLTVTVDGMVRPGLRRLPCSSLWH